MHSEAATLPQEPATRINYGAWLWRVFTWDGVIALALMAAPLVLQQVLREDGEIDNRDDREAMLAAIFIPIGALLLRFWIGSRHLALNRCGDRFLQFQSFCFFAGLFAMLLGECIVLSVHDMLPPGDFVIPLVMILPFYAVYLACMTVAMYPGREPISEQNRTRIGNWEVSN